MTFTKLIFEFKKYYLTTVIESNNLPEYRLFNEFKEYDNGEENHGEENNAIVSSEDDQEIATSKKTTKISIIDFARSLKKAADIYAKIINRTFDNKNVNQYIYNLQRIESTPAFTLLLSLFQQNIDDKTAVNILKVIESFMLRRHICEYRTGELDNIFSKLTNVSRNNILGEVKNQLTKYTAPR